MILPLSSFLYISVWVLYVVKFIKNTLLDFRAFTELRYPFFALHFLLYMGLLGTGPLESLVPFVEGFDRDHLPPFSYENIDGLQSLRCQQVSALYYVGLFASSGLLFWGLLLVLLRKSPIAKIFITQHLIIHLLLSLLFALSQKFYVLGTDKLGNDLFIQCFFAIKTGLSFAFIAMFVSVSLGLIVGLLSGFSRGFVGYAFDYFYNVVNAIPSILLLILVLYFVNEWSQSLQGLTSSLYQEVSLFSLALSLALTQWVPLCRLIRGQVFVLREADFIQVLPLMNVSKTKIFFKHLLPHLRGILFLSMIFDISQYLLAEALLTFIGIGFSGDVVSFGMIINENRYAFLNTPIIWWPLFSVFMTLTPLVLSLNMIADYIEKRSYENRGHKDVRD